MEMTNSPEAHVYRVKDENGFKILTRRLPPPDSAWREKLLATMRFKGKVEVRYSDPTHLNLFLRPGHGAGIEELHPLVDTLHELGLEVRASEPVH